MSPQPNSSLSLSQVFGQGLDLYASQVQRLMRKRESEKINTTNKEIQSRVSFNNMKIKEQIVDIKELITTGSSLL